MFCANCKYNDGLVYTSYPPQYKCTITNEFHFGDYQCDVDLDEIEYPEEARDWRLLP